MISIKVLIESDIELCYKLDSDTISLCSKEQWVNEFKKEETRVFGISLSNLIKFALTVIFYNDSKFYFLNINT